MYQILNHFKEVPPFIKGAFADHTLIAVILLVIFVLAVFMTNKVATLCRYIVVIAGIAAATFGFVFKRFPYFWTAAGALAILIVIRLLLYTIRTIRQNRIDRRIEERALAKAASRRGSWKNRQGYSGHARAIEDDYVPGKMSRDEIKQVIENERAEASEKEAVPAAEAKAEPAAEMKAEPAAEMRTEPAAEVKAESAAEAKTEPAPETKAEPAAEVKAEAISESAAETEAERAAE